MINCTAANEKADLQTSSIKGNKVPKGDTGGLKVGGIAGQFLSLIQDEIRGRYRTKAVNFYSDAGNLSYIEVSSFVLRYKVHQL